MIYAECPLHQWLLRLSPTVAFGAGNCRRRRLPDRSLGWECRCGTCAACGKKQLQMLRCSRCKAAFYCDAACQKRHWQEHKAACGEAAAGGQGGAGGASAP